MKRRGSLTFGIILILLGVWFMTVQFIPEIGNMVERYADWPVWVLGPGLIFIFAGLISGVFDLFIPGTIISTVGLILYYQNETGDWQSWSYAWALIIVGVGVGVFLSHFLRGKFRTAFSEGVPPMITGATLFLIFGSIFRATFGQEPFLGDYWPLLLIFGGLVLLVQSIFRSQRRSQKVVVNINTEADAEVFAEEPEENWEKELEAALEADEAEDEA